jgi:hypothetical protein
MTTLTHNPNTNTVTITGTITQAAVEAAARLLGVTVADVVVCYETGVVRRAR